jgi:acetyl esterase/lipase
LQKILGSIGFMKKGFAPMLVVSAAAVLISAAIAQTSLTIPAAISPEAQEFYRSLRPRPPLVADYENPATMQRIRDGLGRMFLATARRITTDYELEQIDADGVRAYWIHTGAPAHPAKVIVYLHGGGYILGSATTNLGVPLRVGPAARTPVLSVEYRLAPEQPFPAALDDSLAVYRWLLAHGYEGRDIALMGDSAGGGLALALALAVKNAKLPLPAAIAVLSPLTDLSPASDTRETLAEYDPIVVGDPTRRFATYAGKHDVHDPLVSPVYGDFRGISPLLIQVGTREVLLSDSVRLARQARQAGVDVTLDVWEGMWHVWQEHPVAPESRQAAVEIGIFLERHLTAKR